MGREFDGPLAMQKTRSAKSVEGTVRRASGFERSDTLGAENFAPTVHRPMPSRQQSEDFPESNQPTPDNYFHENKSIPKCIRESESCARYLERNSLCRLVGGVGPRLAHKNRGWVMGCSSCITFTMLLLLIVPLLANAASADMTTAFSLAKGKLNWRLLIPLDWTNRVHVSLVGMTNVTKRGDPYFVKFTTPECEEVFTTACEDCKQAAVSVNIFVILGLVTIVPALCFDLHRIFVYWDLNFSKVTGIILHLALGVPFSVLAFISFLQKCYMKLPTYTIHDGVGRKGIGIDIVWELGVVTWILLAILIMRPIPGLLHLLVPTPIWANNLGMKGKRKKDLEPMVETITRGPFSEYVTTMRPETDGYEEDEVVKPANVDGLVHAVAADEEEEPADAVVIRTGSLAKAAPGAPASVIAPEESRKHSSAGSDTESARNFDVNDFVSARKPGAEDFVSVQRPEVEASPPDFDESPPSIASEVAEPPRRQSNATGEDLTAPGTAPSSRRGSVAAFVDPWEGEGAAEEGGAEEGGAPAVEREASAEVDALPDDANVATKAMTRKSKKTKKKGGTELAPTKKM